MKTTTILILLLLATSLAFSQKQETIDSDRPGQSYSGKTVGEKVFQIQSGLNFFSMYPEIGGKLIILSSDVRYGILESLELNATLAFSNFAISEPIRGYTGSASDFSDYQVGGKLSVLTSENNGPNLSLQGSLLFSLNNLVAPRRDNGFMFSLNYSDAISDKISIRGNLRLMDDGKTPDYLYLYSLMANFKIDDKYSCFIEAFGLLQPIHNTSIDAGFSQIINEDVLFDFSGGWLKLFDGDQWFIDAGISFRFGGNKK